MFSQNSIFGQNINGTSSFFSKPAPVLGQSAFGNAVFGGNKPASNAFTSNVFGAQSQPQKFGSMFNPPLNQAQNNNITQNMFSPAPSNNNPFGITSSQDNSSVPVNAIGSPIKFSAVPGVDNISKGGLCHPVNVSYQSACMIPNYEKKAFEEMRFEDYQMGKNKAPKFFSNNTSLNYPQKEDHNKAFSNSFAQPSFNSSASSTLGGANNNPFGFNFTSTTPPQTNAFKTDTITKPSTLPSFAPSTNTFQSNTMFQNQNLPKPANQMPFFNKPLSSGFSFGSNENALLKSSLQQSTTPVKITPLPSFGTPVTLNNTFPPQMTHTITQTPTMGFNTTQALIQPSLNFTNATNTFASNNNNIKPSVFNLPSSVSTATFPTFKPLSAPNVMNTPNTSPFQPAYFSTPQSMPQTFTLSSTKTPEQVQENLQGIVSHYDFYGANCALSGLQPLRIPANQYNHYVTNPKEMEEILKKESPPIKPTPSIKVKTYAPKPSSKMFDTFSFDRYVNGHQINDSLGRKMLLLKPTKSGDLHSNSHAMLTKSIDDFMQKSCESENLDGSFIKKTKEYSAVSVNGNTMSSILFRQESFEHKMNSKISSSASFYTDESDSESIYEDAIDDPSIVILNMNNSSSYQESKSEIFISRKAPKEMSQPVINEKIRPYNSNPIENILQELPNCLDTIEKLCCQYGCNTFKDKNNNCAIIKQPFDTCGVIFTRKDYYMIPDFSKIHKYKTEDGKCIINGLTIGRLGYGNIYFLSAVNIAGINIDEILFFEKRSITIYPDNVRMPEEGEGLNVPSQITLDNVFPRNNRKEDIINPFGQTLTKYVQTLKRICDKMNAEFVDYRPETGSWVFIVQHF